MPLFDFFSKTDETKNDSMESFAADDLDLITSPADGHLVAVYQRNGVHVCWVCPTSRNAQFVHDPSSPLRPVEFNCGGEGTRIWVHSKCANKAAKRVQEQGNQGSLFWNGVGRHQARREMTRLTKPFDKDRKDQDAG